MPRISVFLSPLLLALILAAPAHAQQEPEPLFNVEPKAGGPGTRFAFMATGFLAGEELGVWLNDPEGRPVAAFYEQLGRVTGFGRADWYWTVPRTIRPGAWTMIAWGKQSHVQRMIPITILAAATPSAPAQPAPPAQGVEWNLEPKAGGPGTRFAFVAFGFRGGERVGVWLNTPHGQPLPAAAEQLGPATSGGRVDWYWTVPAYFQPGTWQMVARGLESGVERIIPVQIR
jgi:hypothetical protein